MNNCFSIDGNKIIWRKSCETLWVEPWGPHSVRVRCTHEPLIRETPWALLSPHETLCTATVTAQDEAELVNGNVTVIITATGWIRFFRTADKQILLEEKPHPRVRYFQSHGGGLYKLEARFMSYPDERMYGLGQHKHGFLNQKGCSIELHQENSEIAIPFMVSSRGYGFLWNNPAVGRVDLARNQTLWTAERSAQLDYWVTAGDTPADILKNYAVATGFPPQMPQWATGFWQSRLRYSSQDEVLRIAREHKKRGLPMSVIVIDACHWTAMGDWQFDPEYWPDPKAMVNELNSMGIQLAVSVWPTVNMQSENYAAMEEQGMLVNNERGLPLQNMTWDVKPGAQTAVRFYDATNPAARQYMWEKIRDHYYSYGIKIFWLDACEPEINHMDFDLLRFYLGNGCEVANCYPLLHGAAFYDGLHAQEEKEILTLSRSAWAGSQRFGTAVWSGDLISTFESLEQSIPAGLNMAMSGIPWWTTDIGGFYNGNIDSAEFRELVVRWFQYAVFCPLFRLHGVRVSDTKKGHAENEVWSFGDEAYGIIVKLLFMREVIRPYVALLMENAHTTGIPPMRPLFLEFHDDPDAAHVEDQFMFGPEICIAPVIKANATHRKVYLPQGKKWRNAFTGKMSYGGTYLEEPVTLSTFPVYLVEDSTIKLIN